MNTTLSRSFRHAVVAFALVSILAASLAGAATPPSGKVNINTATAEQLAKLPRIGPKVAERIIEFRKASGGFKLAEELMGVKGIGEKMFEALEPYVAVSGETTLVEKVASPRAKRSANAKTAE